MVKIFATDFDTISMVRRFCASMHEFLTMVTEGVVFGVHKAVIQSSISVIWGQGIRRYAEVELRLMEVASW